jgi:hypothetical protein
VCGVRLSKPSAKIDRFRVLKCCSCFSVTYHEEHTRGTMVMKMTMTMTTMLWLWLLVSVVITVFIPCFRTAAWSIVTLCTAVT